MTGAGDIRIWLCGGLRIEVDGARVESELKRRKSRELLATLLHRQHPVPRDELIEQLWPDEAPGARDGALRQLLTELRKCLGTSAIEGRSEVSLALPESVWVDVRAAELSLHSCQEAFEAGTFEHASSLAAEAAELLTGTFLVGDESPWIESRRRELEVLELAAIEGLAASELSRPDATAEAVQAARRLVARAPFRESGYSLLMRALVEQGNMAEALLAYEQLRSLLRRELGTTPSLKMAALHGWVLEQADPDHDGVTVRAVQQGGRGERAESTTDAAVAYATRPDGVNIAYQVIGDGPQDLVLVPGFMSHLDLQWADDGHRSFLRRLAVGRRLIVLDKAGTGASDAVGHAQSLDEWASDVTAVLDEVGSMSAVLLGASEASAVAITCAHAHPRRISGLILYAPVARVLPEPGYLWDQRAAIESTMNRFREVEFSWGQGAIVELMTPELAASESQRRAWAIFERSSGSPASIQQRLEAILSLDARPLLPKLRVATLILHRSGDQLVPIYYGRFVAEAMPAARYVELPGSCHPPYLGEQDEVDAWWSAIDSFMADVPAEPQRAGTLVARPAAD